MTNNSKRFTLLALSCSMMFGLVLTACFSSPNNRGGLSPETGSGTNGSTVEAPFKLSIMMGSTSVEFPQPGNEIQKMIEKYTNTQLDIRAYPDQTLHELMPAIISSGDLPMALAFGGSQLSQSYMINAMKSGNFWDVKPYLDRFPNLSKINPLTFENYELGGKIYGLPKVRPLARFGVCYRQDWADKLGLSEPQTIEEFYEMARAFTEDDPDGNGANDTYGITKGGGSLQFGVWHGAPNGWAVKDGKFIRDVETPEYLEGLQFEQLLLNKGFLHPEYFIMNRSQYEKLFFDGRAGMYMNTSSCAGYEEIIKQRNPLAVLNVFSLLEGPVGKRVVAERGHNGIIVFPKTSVKTEEDLLKVLRFFDQFADEEMSNLMTWGIEGEHYHVVNGRAVPVPEKIVDLDDRISRPYSGTMAVIPHIVHAMEGERKPLDIKADELNAENEQFVVPNPSMGLVSETFAQRGSDLEQILSDANVRFVTGAIDADTWRSEVGRWRSSGGQAIAEQFAAAAAER